MPEYLAPGVYIEERSFRNKIIEGVSTSTAGFVGPARFGPTSGVPELVTSLAEFERVFGGLDPMDFEDESSRTPNFLAHGVREFFENGGRRLYVTRVYEATGSSEENASLTLPTTGSPPVITIEARYPGSGGNVRLAFTVRVGENALIQRDGLNAVSGLRDFDLVWIGSGSPETGDLYWSERYFDATSNRETWKFNPESGSALELEGGLTHGTDQVRVVTVNVQVTYPGKSPRVDVWENLSFHPAHERSLSRLLTTTPASRGQATAFPLIFRTDPGTLEGPQIARTLLEEQHDIDLVANLASPNLDDADRTITLSLTAVRDGNRPDAGLYEGDERDPSEKRGLKAFEDIPDISIVAAPGYSYRPDDALPISQFLITHCERMQYRIAVLDSARSQDIPGVRALRAQVDSTHAALYYPWVRILDPILNEEVHHPPSGFVAGIYARNDVEEGVHKAPANEIVRLAVGFEVMINKAQQDVLNPEGINCFRYFEGRGYRLWGARTISSDPEWKYVNLRRYFAYLERSIDRGTQWAVFEPNADALWGNVRSTVEDFLFNEWKSGHLLGLKPEEAYFVRCDRSTMTQNDLDNGRLICLVGVAPIRPAEFVIFRIGQWTADRRA